LPANLTAEAKAKWEKAIAIKDPEEKIKALQEFLSAIPKHKGNERLRDQVKRKIAALRAELEERRQKRRRASSHLWKRRGPRRY
jgi:ribosome-interacting GTPase 1